MQLPDCIKVANTWTSDLEPNLIDAFKVIDKNGDGRLSYKEIKRLLVSVNLYSIIFIFYFYYLKQHGLADEKEIQQIFNDSDINRDGFVDYKEVCLIAY
jgi:Ca2+-binding EF-hand superfamily protein